MAGLVTQFSAGKQMDFEYAAKMMKWKVVKNPRSASADRSLECLKTDAPFPPRTDSNNNEQDAITSKENNKHAHQDPCRRPSKTASDCIPLKSFLGLSRQRSESNLSCPGTEPRRGRSQARGSSCDRITLGYHTTPLKSVENRNFDGPDGGFKLENVSKTRCSSPPRKSSCWLRGRKRERETKGNLDVPGKTIVTGSNKKTSSKSKTCSNSSVTIVDGSDSKDKTKVCSSTNCRKNKFGKKSFDEEVIIEDVIYSAIDHENTSASTLEDSNREACKDHNKVIRKKGQAPKPQITTALFKEDNNATTASLNGKKIDKVISKSPCSKPPRKSQTFSGRNQDKKAENTNAQTRDNNFRSSERSFDNDQTNANNHLIAIAEIHKNSQNGSSGGISKSVDASQSNTNVIHETILPTGMNSNTFNNEENFSAKERVNDENNESAPFYIDTPDYSTLESEAGKNSHVVLNNNNSPSDEGKRCNDSNQTEIEHEVATNENAKTPRVNSLSSILRDSSGETKGSENEPKKSVRFQKMDLIEQYKKHKADSSLETEDESEVSHQEHTFSESESDINSNETPKDKSRKQTLEASSALKSDPDVSMNDSNPDSTSRSFTPSPTEKFCNGMMVNVLVRNATPDINQTNHYATENSLIDAQPQLVVKKSFVLTIAKQEKGFKSLCANKKPDACLPENLNEDPHISVTFLCSAEPHSEAWMEQGPPGNTTLRLRSLSVPPQAEPPSEVTLPTRSRSRERRCKDRQHCKKNHKVKKKDAVFHMPQAVIDELSQVLEKRKPSLDDIPA